MLTVLTVAVVWAMWKGVKLRQAGTARRRGVTAATATALLYGPVTVFLVLPAFNLALGASEPWSFLRGEEGAEVLRALPLSVLAAICWGGVIWIATLHYTPERKGWVGQTAWACIETVAKATGIVGVLIGQSFLVDQSGLVPPWAGIGGEIAAGGILDACWGLVLLGIVSVLMARARKTACG